MYSVVLLSVLLVTARAQYTCAKDGGEGPCVSGAACGPGTSGHLCPDNQACIVNATDDLNSICCAFADLTTGTATSETTVAPVDSSCVDKVNPATGISDCIIRAYLCDNSDYYTFMTEQCPKTCNRCSSSSGTGPSTSTCADKLNPSTGVSDCPGDKYLCQNAAYMTLMKEQCPKTCGYC